MKINKIIYTIACLSIAGLVQAQWSITPGAAQSRPVLLKGGIAHIGNGQVIQNSVVGFDKGKLTVVGDATTTRIDESIYEVIAINGKHVYPGFILPNTNLGLSEVGALRHTLDYVERGELNPNVRSLVAYNTDSEIIPTFRFNGILMAQITPRGGTISGTSSVVQLDAWNWEDAVVKADNGIHMNWPSRISGNFDFSTFTFEREPNKDYNNQVDEIYTFFKEAVSYGKLSNKKEANLKLEAMQGLFDGTKTLYINVDVAKEIIESITMAKEMGVTKIVLVGGSQVMMVADFIKENNIAVITANTHRTPSNADLDIDLPYKLPYLLQQKGIKFAIGYSGGSTSFNSRNLPFSAGTAVAYGLTKEQALQAITKSAAEILGIESSCGTLESGKDATLFISAGDALDMRGNQLEKAYIKGRQIQLDGMQQALYNRYKEKYGHE